jgi:hypothetical protein
MRDGWLEVWLWFCGRVLAKFKALLVKLPGRIALFIFKLHIYEVVR